MDWSKYSSLKSGSKVSFGKEKQLMREAVAEVQDDDAVEKADVDEAYVKGRLMNSLKAKVRHYDEAKQAVSYSSFEPSLITGE